MNKFRQENLNQKLKKKLIKFKNYFFLQKDKN